MNTNMMDFYDKTYLKGKNTFSSIDPDCITEELCHHAVSQFGENIRYVPKQFRTKNLWEYAIMRNPSVILYLDEEYQSFDIYMYALTVIVSDEYNDYLLCKDVGDIIEKIPTKYITDGLIKFIIDNSIVNNYFGKIDKSTLTKELCMYAFDKQSSNIVCVPKEYVTKEMWLQAIGTASMFSDVFKHVPEEYYTEELCKKIIQKSGSEIEYLPKKFINADLCEIAIQQSNYVMKYVPDEYITEELVLKYPNTIQYIDKKHMTQKIVDMYITQEEFFLCNIPDEYKTKDICEMAVKKCFSKWHGPVDINKRYCVLEHMPKEYLSLELCKNQRSIYLENIPSELINKEFYNWYLKDCFSIQGIPEEYLTYDICKNKVNRYSGNLQYVPDKFKTKELCEIAILKGWFVDSQDAIQYVPEEFITSEMLEMSLDCDYDPLLNIPDKFQTEELCKKALLDANVDIITVPYKYITKGRCEKYIIDCPDMIHTMPYKYLTKELYNLALKSSSDSSDEYIERLKKELETQTDISKEQKEQKEQRISNRIISKNRDLSEIHNIVPPYLK